MYFVSFFCKYSFMLPPYCQYCDHEIGVAFVTYNNRQMIMNAHVSKLNTVFYFWYRKEWIQIWKSVTLQLSHLEMIKLPYHITNNFYIYIMLPYLCNPETKNFLDQNLEMKNLLIFSYVSKNYNMVIYKGFKAKDFGFLDFDPKISVSDL